MKKRLLVLTGLVLTMGGTVTGENPVFAAEYSILKKDPAFKVTSSIGYIETNKNWFAQNKIFKFSPYSNSGFKVITTQEKERAIDFAENDNRDNSEPQTVRSAVRSFSQTDSMTLNANVQFNLGQQLSASIELPMIVKISTQFSAQQIIGAGVSKMTSKTETLSYGGDAIEAKPHQLKKVAYIFKERTYFGELNTGTQITGTGPIKVISSGKTFFVDNLEGNDLYGFFKELQQLNDKEKIRIMKVDPRDERAPAFDLLSGHFAENFFIDDTAKTVSTVGNKAMITGISGIGLIMRTTTGNKFGAKLPIVEEKIIKVL
ncbi:hypothetical protein ABEZ87_19060 [Bacillus mycoides]|uniref:hypothetical protein n=1 Tax=Bacillus mycoides TaxID=1405 RepID=UPI002B43D1AC